MLNHVMLNKTSRSLSTLAISLIIPLSLPQQALAQAPTELEPVVVTGSYSATKTDNITSNITVISKADISKSNKANLVEVLRTVPGLSISQAGGNTGIVDISIRGGESNYTLVLIDGVQVNDPTNTRGGSYNFNQLSLSQVERIEVIKGGQSAIYGSDALSGVINIITHAHTEELSQSISLAAGQEGYNNINYSVANSFDDLSVSLKLSGETAGEFIESTEAEKSAASLSALYHFNESTSINSTIRRIDSDLSTYPEQSGGPLFAVSADLETTESDESSMLIQLDHKFNAKIDSEVSINAFERNALSTTPGIAPFTRAPSGFSDINYKKNTLALITSYKPYDSLLINIGLDTKDEEGTLIGTSDTSVLAMFIPDFPAESVSDFSLERDHLAAFIESNYHVKISDTSQWSFSGSVRSDKATSTFSDNTERKETESSLHIGTKYIVDNMTWHANFSEGFKLPSFYALAEPNVGSQDLLSELSTTVDLGVSFELGNTYTLSTSVFNSEYENLIDFVGVLVNLPKVEVEGGEFSFLWKTSDNITHNFDSSYAHIKSNQTLQIKQRPQLISRLNTNWEFRANWNAHLGFSRTGERFDSSIDSTTGDVVTSTLEAYNLADAGLSYQSQQYGSYTLNIDNINDKEYQDAVGFPGIERSVRLSWNLNF